VPVIEKCLNHVSGSFRGIVSVYQRYEYFDEMKDAMQKWDDHTQKTPQGVSCDITGLSDWID